MPPRRDPPIDSSNGPRSTWLNAQRGEGRFGLLLALALTGAAVFTAVKIVPARIAAYEFRDTLREEVRFASVRDGNETVARRLLDKAAELRIPLKKENLQIQRSRTEVVIRAHYEQPIDLKLTTYTYRFKAEERAPLF